MPLKIDVAQQFAELGDGLIPRDESILGVLRATPKGEIFRRGSIYGGMRSLPMTYEGEAAGWPHLFAQDKSRPGYWRAPGDWYFWIVLTNKHLHVFEGRTGKRAKPERPGPEAAHFPVDRIEEIRYTKQWGISDLTIWFKDGSSVELDVVRQTNLDQFVAAIRPFERPGSTRPRAKSWMPAWMRWAMALALLALGMALTAGASDSAHDARVFDYRGQEATARVTGTTVGPDERPRLAVEFSDDIGFSSETEIRPCDAVADAQPGDEIVVVYDPDDLSLAHPAECELTTQGPLGLLLPGIASLALGTFLVIRAWGLAEWKWRRIVGIPIVVFGALMGATALTEPDCFCLEFVYFGAALVIIGVVAQIGPGRRAPTG